MIRRQKPFGSLGLSDQMPRHKTEDERRTEKILREEQDKEAKIDRIRGKWDKHVDAISAKALKDQ